mgnify:FL=1
MVVEHYWLSGQVLVLDSPETNIFPSAGDESVGFGGAELDGEDVEVGDLFGEELWFSREFDVCDVEHEDGLAFVGVESDHG